ncbi:MAG: amino acid adenylation domain-containing protein, partial [Sciscionella sp.]
WTSHHVLLDGWSTGQIFTEVCQDYANVADDRTPRRRPFRDYLRWLGEQDEDRAEEYWRGVLLGVDSPTPLPYDRQPATAHRAESSEVVRLQLSEEESTQVYQTAKRNGLTVNTVVQGMWALLLSRYSGERDVVFGSTVSGRPADLPGVESMVGMFINTVPTRVLVDGSENALSWLRGLQLAQSESRRFDFVSLARLQSLSDLPAGANLFDSAVVFENYPFDQAAVSEHGVSIREVDALDSTSFPLSLGAYSGQRLGFGLAYDPALFDALTVRRLVSRLRLLLGAVAEDPDRPISALPTLTEDELRQVLRDWNDTVLDVAPVTFPELFEGQVRRTPDATALVSCDETYSFRDLNARANRLAHLLVGLGAGPERTVALALPRSAEMVVGMLAVLKAGAAYLPVDTEQPHERLEFVLSDAAPSVVVTLAAEPPCELAAETVILALEDPGTRNALASQSDADPIDAQRISPLRAENTAYAIYTSGSTGRPKGVAVEHHSLANLFHAQRADLMQPVSQSLGGERLRMALTAAFFFDASWEGPLFMAAGHELHLIGDDVRLDPRALMDYVADKRIHLLNLTPSYVQQLLPAGLLNNARHRPSALILGGEATGASLWRELNQAGGVVSYNYYGPTECTVDAVCCRFDEHDRPTIGRPLRNVRCYVLDADTSPVPVGVPGELFLAGEQLARGYLNRPGLTADRFLADPFGPAGTRMYRTGDRVRWTERGVLEYLGRADDQVKIRGFRIEPGEVEVALLALPEIAEAAVLAWQDSSGLNRLVAYLAAASGAELPDVAELRATLAGSLPEYMVPSAFVPVPRLPLNANGKLDRRALPEPDFGAARSAEHRDPRTEIERIVADIWAEVLGVDQIGVQDDFFSLGGDSILSIRVISRMRAALDVELSPRAIFNNPTVAGLAGMLPAGLRMEDSYALLPVVSRDEPLPLSFAQQRLWFLNEFEPDSTEYVTRLAVRLRGELDVTALGAAFDALVARHESLRTTFDAVDGRGVQVVHSPAPVALPTVDLSCAPESALEEVLAEETDRTFDLCNGPLLRTRLVVLAPEDHVLVLSMHHIVTDGWSTGLLTGEL